MIWRPACQSEAPGEGPGTAEPAVSNRRGIRHGREPSRKIRMRAR